MASFLRRGVIAGVVLLAPLHAHAQVRVDILIRNGSVIDGTGRPARLADVGITGDRITFLGDARTARLSPTTTVADQSTSASCSADGRRMASAPMPPSTYRRAPCAAR
jgi:hypothetical protein